MTNPRKAYLEHVAIFVRDIHFHIRFFEEVLGMTMREVDGTPEDTAPVLDARRHAVHRDAGLRRTGRPARALGVMCEDLEAALAAARTFDVKEMPQGRNWLRLPDGLAVEFIQARGDAVAPRARDRCAGMRRNLRS